MINLPLKYERKFSYSMGECDDYYVVRDNENKFIFSTSMCNEELFKELIKKVNEITE